MIKNIGDFVAEIAASNLDIALACFKLRPPVERTVLHSIIEKQSLPTEIADILYSHHDGQEYGALKLFGEFAMLPIKDSVEIYEQMVEEFADDEMGHSPDHRIRGETIWRKRWFPFAWDQNNNDHLCLDFDPTDAGTPGQVIYCPRWGNLTCHASSFAEFLNFYFSKLESVGFALEDNAFEEFDCRVNPFGS